MTLMEILTAIGRKAGSWAHERAVQGILDTPPIVAQDDGVILFSMIGTAVLLPYLVAVKSLHHHLPRGKVVLLDDGTLTADDKAVLAKHCDTHTDDNNDEIEPNGEPVLGFHVLSNTA